jgi:hypothetical protein
MIYTGVDFQNSSTIEVAKSMGLIQKRRTHLTPNVVKKFALNGLKF